MLSLIIADDEFLILERLKRIVDYEEEGYTLVATASNGADALAQIKALKPDVAILDIKMPYLSGLEIAAQVRESKLRTRVIILTSYDYFDFARQAIQQRVQSYLLKPIRADELSKILRETKREIEAERKATEKLREYDMQEVSRNIYYFLTGSRLSPEADAATRACFDAGQAYRLILAKVENADFMQDLTLQIRRILDVVVDLPQHIFIPISDNVFCLFFHQEDCTYDFATGLHQALMQHLHAPIDMAVSASSDIVSSFPALYTQARLRLAEAVFDASSVLIYETPRSLQVSSVHHADLYGRLCPLLQNADVGQAVCELHACFLQLKEALNLEYFEALLYEFFSACFHCAGTSADSQHLGISFRIRTLLDSCNSCQTIENWCVQYLSSQFGHAAAERPELTLAVRIQTLIQSQYSNPDLSLSYIAGKLGYTPNYISTVFKKEVGLSVVQYITERRMIAARRLLADEGMSVNLVFQKVGYSSPFYFSKRFKQYYGTSPSELFQNRK